MSEICLQLISTIGGNASKRDDVQLNIERLSFQSSIRDLKQFKQLTAFPETKPRNERDTTKSIW